MRYSTVFFVGAAMLLSAGAICEGKSVFAIASHANGRIKAYKVVSDHVDFQTTLQGTENFGVGATGLCSWTDYERLFTTYEGSPKIAWASSKTLNRENDDAYDAPESNLAGMAVDDLLGALYVITRNGGKLYTFQFDEQADTLVLIYPDGQNAYRQLSGVSGETFGIALEQGSILTGGTLYVANGTAEIHCYNTYTWDLTRTINVGKSAISLDVDANGYLYAGGHWNHTYLLRYDLLADPNSPGTIAEKDIGAGVTDVKIDPETGYLYMTTRRTSYETSGTVEVYDPSNWVWDDPNTLLLKDVEYDSDFSDEGPAGLAIGPTYKAPRIFVEKVDDVDESSESVLPNDEVTYSIKVHAGADDETNVVVADKLPVGVDFVIADPNTGDWDSVSRLYTWPAVNLPGYDPNTWTGGDPNEYFTLTVRVNELAEPLADLENIVMAESDEAYTEAKEYTPVDCFGGDIICVNRLATGAKTGTSWTNAYTNLQNALARAGKGCGAEIWVAQGTYRPGGDPINDTFRIPAGVAVYGGFAGYETLRDQRNWKLYETILSGYIGQDEFGTARNNTVVTMGDNSLLDGFTVTEGGWQGIDGSSVSSAIINCIVKKNEQRGLFCKNGNITVQWCEVRDNEYQGIYHEGNGYLLNISNCVIHDNQWDGLLIEDSTSYVKNSVISQNGSGGSYYGIRLIKPSSSPVIHNNTLCHNTNESIKFTGSYLPDTRNCIIWSNNNDGNQLAGLEPDEVYYSCIQDCNDINYQNNINDYPRFAYSYPEYGYYHLAADSPCIDVGDATYVDPNGTGEWDIDGDERIINGYVDIGADEFSCGDVSSSADLTGDGIVNFEDFGVLSAAWLSTDPNESGTTTDPNYIGQPQYRDPAGFVAWNGLCDFDSDYDVDLNDLAYFVHDGYWLWSACWRTDLPQQMAMAGSGGPMLLASEPLSMTSSTISDTSQPESSIEERYATALDVVVWLEKLWFEDEDIRSIIDKDDWKLFMKAVYEWLDEIELVYKNSKD
jgi:uncharacterized repeat protein (TIGR01451 family)